MSRRFTSTIRYGVKGDDITSTVSIGTVSGSVQRWVAVCFHDCEECGALEDVGVFWLRGSAVRWGERWVESFRLCHSETFYS